MSHLHDKIAILEKVFGIGGRLSPKKPDLNQIPFWVTNSINVHTLIFGENGLHLIEPKRPLSYEMIVSGQKLLERHLLEPVLIIADELNPKYRPLFVRSGISFIYRNKTLFAPSLGFQLNKFEKLPSLAERELAKSLSPFEFKLVAGNLSGHLILKNFNLNSLQEELQNRGYRCSKGKLSMSVNNLIGYEILNEMGRGPTRTLTFNSKESLWQTLHELTISKTHRTIESNFSIETGNEILSGESALARFSNLNDPITNTYATTKKGYEFLKERAHINHEEKILIDLRKEDPRLFSVNNCLNPIEIYFELKSTADERIQIALDEMLSTYGLKGSYDA